MQNFHDLISNGFIGILTAGFILFIDYLRKANQKYKEIKESPILQDIFNVYRHFQDKEILEIEKHLKSPYLSKEDKASLLYELRGKILQKRLKMKEENLSILRFFQNLIYTDYAIRLYNNCKSLLNFNEEEQKFEAKEIILPEKAKKLETIGASIFFTNGIFAYILMVYLLYFFDTGINFKNNIELAIMWGCFNVILMLGIVYIGTRILKYFMRQSNALTLLELKKKDLIQILNESPADATPPN